MKSAFVSVIASFPIDVIDVGRSTLFNDLHPWKVPSSIDVIYEGIVILSNEVQYFKANFPILDTEVGITTLISDEHLLKEDSPISVTDE